MATACAERPVTPAILVIQGLTPAILTDLAILGDRARRADQMLKLGTLRRRASFERA
jgi:hypothetical protein